MTENGVGEELAGKPDDFTASSGEGGRVVLDRILPRPELEQFRRGVIRGAIAEAHFVALLGVQERSLEQPFDYAVNDGTGTVGVASFQGAGCVAAVASSDPSRTLSLELQCRGLSESLVSVADYVCSRPLLRSPSQVDISAIFWSEGAPLVGADRWSEIYEFTGDLFRMELLDDEVWQHEMIEHHESSYDWTSLVLELSRQTAAGKAADLSDMQRDLLVPREGEWRRLGLNALLEVGLTFPEP